MGLAGRKGDRLGAAATNMSPLRGFRQAKKNPAWKGRALFVNPYLRFFGINSIA
jgi:hypothetical protein